MKKTLSIFLAVLMVITALPLTAITSFAATSGDFQYSVISEYDKTCEITLYLGSATNLAIPSTLDGYSVTSIGGWAFLSCDSLTSITIPDSVTSIGEYAFLDCTSLASINVSTGNTVYSSVDGVLFNKDKTELIQYPIGNARTTYTIPDSVTSIGDGAFEYCTSLASITIPDSVTSIGGYAFSWCTSLTDVYYTGTEEQWNSIKIGEYNECLTSATIHYNYVIPTHNGWTLDNSKWAYYENGEKVTNKWVMDSVTWCYVGADGYCVTNKWVMDSVTWCYVGADGRMVTNKWMKDSKGWCYLGADGRMVTNKWVKDSVTWCYVGADGYCVTNQWKADSHGWCYLDSNGRMMTNSWLQWNGDWYYLDENGYMVTGTKVINGKTHKFNSNGVWIG